MAIAGDRWALKSQITTAAGGQNGDVRWVWHMKQTLHVWAVIVGVREALPCIRPVLVLIGSLTMIVFALCKDWPQ
jgi:hypothetical protein